MEPKFLKNTTLHERQMRYYNGHYCPYCNSHCDYVDSIAVYQESYGMIYICFPCKAWVNVHNQTSDQAFGFVAKKDLRELRHQTHLKFDPLWQRKVGYGMPKQTAQSKARKWLAEILHIDIVECHIGMFDHEKCNATIAECSKYYLTEEQKQEIMAYTELNAYLVIESLNDLAVSFKEFNINGQRKFEIAHPTNGKIFHYFPRINSGGYDLKKIKPLDIEIEEFLFQNFNHNTNEQL